MSNIAVIEVTTSERIVVVEVGQFPTSSTAMTGPEIVTAIDEELGSDVWQTGGEGGGTDGADGNTILSGTGAPDAALGVDGDYYMDTATTTIYGPKAAGAWPAGIVLPGTDGQDGTDGVTPVKGVDYTDGTDGQDGADGNTILSGTGAPDAALGVDGDYYMDTATTTIYGPKADGARPAGIVLPGTDGQDGTDGADGTIITVSATEPSNPVEGDLWLDIS